MIFRALVSMLTEDPLLVPFNVFEQRIDFPLVNRKLNWVVGTILAMLCANL